MRQNNKRAFTLVEVLIVIVIIGILFIVLMANVDFSTDEAKETGTKAIMQSYKLAAETIALENSGFTNDKAELIKLLNKRLDLELQFYLEDGEIKSNQLDSWGQEFKFMQSTPVNTYGMFAVQSAGPDGIFDNGDDIIMENKYVVVNGVGQVVTDFPDIDPNHSHSYVLRVTEPLFLMSPATCQQAAQYYYSCSCGKMNGSYFTFGVADPDAHGTIVKEPEKKVPDDYAVHYTHSKCSLCNTVLETVENPHRANAEGLECLDCHQTLHVHVYDKEVEANQYKKNDANCTEPLTYYKSCECGAASPDATFVKGSALGHNYTKQTLDHKATNATCADYAKYYLVCYGCNGKGTDTYDYIAGGKNPTNHVGGTRIEYESISDAMHIKKTICKGCNEVLSSVNEPHIGECCHTHSYTQKVESPAYEKSKLTCVAKAVYYKSCACGKSSKDATNETFEGSEIPGHIPAAAATWDSSCNTATVVCTRSGCSVKWTSTSRNEVTTVQGTCVTERQYKHRATFSVNGTSKTFDCAGHTGTKNSSEHLQDPAYPKVATICKWYPCCEEVIDAEHRWNVAEPTCSTAKKCLDCGFIGAETTDHKGEIVFARVASTCQKYSVCGCEVTDHIFGSAACTSPSTCTRTGCGYSTGEALGHDINTTNVTWSNDHSTITFYCNNSGCTETWVKNTTRTVTTSANCVTAEKYKHTLTFEGKSFECTGHTGSANSSVHASGCVLTPLNPGTSSKCQEYSLCKASTSNHNYNVNSVTCSSTVDKTCKTCGYVAQTVPDHTPVNGGTKNVHKKCSVCGTTLQGQAYHSYTSNKTGTGCTGTTTYTCTCGYSYSENGSHTWVTITEATCTENETKQCSVCHQPGTGISAYGHDWPAASQLSSYLNWSSHSNPTYACRNGCGETKSVTSTKETTRTATCVKTNQFKHKITVSGYTYYCGTTHDGETDSSNHEQSPTAYDNGSGTGVATICEYYPCCNTTYSSSHNYNASSAGCTTDKYCKTCNYIAAYATGHSGSKVYAGTASAHYKYSGCGHTLPLSSYPHSYISETCTTAKRCLCGYYPNGTTPPGHLMTDEQTVTSATCTANRTYYKKCSRSGCGYVDTSVLKAESGSKLGHKWQYECSTVCLNDNSHTRSASHKMTGTQPTCTTAGNLSCEYGCGTTSKPAATGHDLGGGSKATWNHADVTFGCVNSGCTKTWDVVGSQKQTQTPTCQRVEKYYHYYDGVVNGQSVYSTCPDAQTGGHEGSKASHNYSVSATCTTAQKCKWCTATTGSALGHDVKWITTSDKSTCDLRCSRCTYVECDWAADHTWSYRNTSSSQHTRTCTRCSYSDTEAHSYHWSKVSDVKAHPLFSGHNDTHDCTYTCLNCPRQKSVTYEACTWDSNNDCRICGQNKG